MDTRNISNCGQTVDPEQHLFCMAGNKRQRKVKTYDFRKPDKFSFDQIRTVALIHETFARLLSSSLSARLHMLSEIGLKKVDQLTYEEFIQSIPNPSTLAVINMDPLKGSAVLEIDPALTFPMIDRLFGGQGKSEDLKRDLTDIEAELMATTLVGGLGNLREAWLGVIDLRPRLITIETNPEFAQIVPPVEMVILVSLEARIGEAKGFINLCFPYLTIEPVIGKLSARYWFSSVRRGGGDKPVEAVSHLKMDAAFYHRGEKLSLAEIGALKRGALIKLPCYAQGDACLEVGYATVLKMKRERLPGKKGMRFFFGAQTGLPEKAIRELVPESSAGEWKSLLDGFSRTLSAEIKEGLSNVHTEIGRLKKKQDEFAEQLYFENTGRENGDLSQVESHTRPFGFIGQEHLEFLFMLIQAEHPQTIALILAYLSPELAGQILIRFSTEARLVLTQRIAFIDRTAPESLLACERVLRIKMQALHSGDYERVGGIEGVVKILNLAPRSLEKDVIEGLEKSNAGFAEEIKMRMFVFEDIVLLDKKAVKKVIDKAKRETLAVALKKTDPQAAAFIRELLTREEQEALAAIQEAKSPLRVTDIERAQQEIVNCIRSLEEKGEIIVARPGETV